MNVRTIDIISPPITLYFKGGHMHSSFFSGILSLLAYAILLAAALYFSQDFINKQNPSAYFFNRYIEDVDSIPINSSFMFNYIQLINPMGRIAKPWEFDKIQIFGVNMTMDSYLNYTSSNGNFLHYHWLYGKCNNDTDTKGIGYLIDEDSF